MKATTPLLLLRGILASWHFRAERRGYGRIADALAVLVAVTIERTDACRARGET